MPEHVGATRKHGEASTYKNGCRCGLCREANRLYQRAATERRSADPALADRAGHGKATTYSNYACRCEDCRGAHAEHTRRQRARRKERAA